MERIVGEGNGKSGRILTRELFLFLLDLEIKRARRYRNFISLLILNLVQSSNSHQGEGPRICREIVTDLLSDEMRETDILGLLSEDKWVAILPYADGLAGGLAKSRFESSMRFYDLKNKGCEVRVQQICFPWDGTDSNDIVRRVMGEII